ncbi:hypothetical protein BKA69DRAFT_1128996 [Paraphysoderma sedebokerense]|nr:hypothetical protein BKA69DRAFT_1128996 [Paraphysoderma sedebokerense]
MKLYNFFLFALVIAELANFSVALPMDTTGDLVPGEVELETVETTVEPAVETNDHALVKRQHDAANEVVNNRM